ncbi:MAG TPA: OB-fold domain-containing protein [Acidimicrobiales bacterium]|jgi:uncharacterized OB-fold protein|nr:OB-fold domain-containing protein [Acidimicrobiales bacterium]
MPANGPSFRVLPRLDDDNRFFWTGGEDGTLRFLRCQSCQQFVHPPVPVCPGCLGRELAPESVSGRATIHSFTVNVQEWIPGSEPYVIGLVSIDEQPDVRLITNLVDCDPDDIAIGAAVEVVFEHQEDVYFPLFRPVSATSSATPDEVNR